MEYKINVTDLQVKPFSAGLEYTPFKCPSSMAYERYKIEKGGRVASGLMCMDIIARKKKFKFKYDIISGVELKVILDVLDSMYAYYDMKWCESGTYDECVVYPGAITYDRFRTDGVWYYKNLNFDLIER